MILILTESFDSSADNVCKWLLHFKTSFVRINSNLDSASIHTVKIEQKKVTIIFKYKSKLYSLNDFSLIWYRRGYFTANKYTLSMLRLPNKIKDVIKSHLDKEIKNILDFTYYAYKNISINNPSLYNLNKLKVLYHASKAGLKIPSTLIAQNKKIVKNLLENNSIITKNISDVLFEIGQVKNTNFLIGQNTEIVNYNDLPKSFYYSLFQAEIKKKYELRIFFIRNKYYPVSIFSQGSENTKVDFRNYDDQFPNRSSTYKLPKSIEKKLKILMNCLELESGSIDMIVDLKNNYYFLEVNPVGQFEWLSNENALYLEREIAKTLIHESKKAKNNR